MAEFSRFQDRNECAGAPGGWEGVIFPNLVKCS